MKGFINFIIKNKLAVWLLTIIVVFTGIFSGTRMKTEMIPDISIPFVMVSSTYAGATPEQVMEDVSMPLERTLENLKNVKAVYSNSYANVASLQVEYEYGIDMDEATRELRSALDNVNLPEEAEEPTVSTISLNMMPVVALSVSSTTEDIVELTSTVEEMLVPNLNKLDGVANVMINGQHIEEVDLVFDEDKLAEYELTQQDVKDMIQASNLSVPLGLYEFEEEEQAIAIDGKFMTVQELKEMLIPVTPSETQPLPFIELEELANIEQIGKVESVSRTNGEDAISIQIVKGQEANTVDVVNNVKDLIAEEEERISGLVVDVSLDQAEPIEDSVSSMIEKALFGGLIAVFIILLFLRDVKSTIISIISIPVSILSALLLLNWLEITLNVMTLGAITVAIGRVIDDSIVVVENIYRRLHLKGEKLNGRALIREATLEMFRPIFSSTIVTVAVFAPLVFVGGMVGELFLPFALTMTFALGASLIVAITIVPALSHTLFKKKLYGDKDEKSMKQAGKFTNWYKGILRWSLNHKVITSVISIALLVGSIALTPLIGFSFLGSQEEKTMYLTYTPATGDLEDETFASVEEVEEELLKRDDVEILQVSISDAGDPTALMMGGGADGALMFVIFDEDTENFSDVKKEVEDYVYEIDHSGVWISQDFNAMSFSSDEISYSFYSENLTRLYDTVEEVEEIMNEHGSIEDVSSTAEDSYVENSFKVDQEELLEYGLTAGQIIGMLRVDTSKEVISTIGKDNEVIDIVVQQEQTEQAKTLDEMLDREVETPLGMVALSDLVTVEEGTTLNTLARSQGEYYATVSGTITDRDISKATADLDEAIEDLEFPKGVTMDVGGVAADMEETFTQLGISILIAIAIVYFILVVTFGEGVAPFSVLFSLPFAVIGSFVGLYLTGETISVTVMMGLLMLIGIIVTNAIVLVDRIVRMERDGMEMREAILEAGTTRLRPIMMTAIATIGALIPLATGSDGGGGGLISKDLAITVIGGLASSTLLTLIVVPVVYEILSKMFKKDRREIEEN